MGIDNLLNNKFLRIIGGVAILASACSCESGNEDGGKQNPGCVDCGDTNIGQNTPKKDTTEYNHPINYHNLLDPCDPLKIETVCLSPQNIGKCTLEGGQYLITKYEDCDDSFSPCYEYEDGGYKKTDCVCTPGTVACGIGSYSSNKRKCLGVGEEGNYDGPFPIWINSWDDESLECKMEVCPKDKDGYYVSNCEVECDDTTGEAVCRCAEGQFGHHCDYDDTHSCFFYECSENGTVEESSCKCVGSTECEQGFCSCEE